MKETIVGAITGLLILVVIAFTGITGSDERHVEDIESTYAEQAKKISCSEFVTDIDMWIEHEIGSASVGILIRFAQNRGYPPPVISGRFFETRTLCARSRSLTAYSLLDTAFPRK